MNVGALYFRRKCSTCTTSQCTVWKILNVIAFSVCRKFSFCCPHCISHRCFERRLLGSRQDAWRSRRCSFWQADNTCSVDRDEALKEWLRSVGIFNWKDWRKKGRKKQCRDPSKYETRPPGWKYTLNWTLTVQTCCLEPVLNTRAQACSEAFWRPRESYSMTSWCLGRSLHCPVLSVKAQKSKLPRKAVKSLVEDSQQSRRETTCTTGKACLTKTSTERTTESRRQSYRRPAGKFAATRKKSSYPSDWQTALKRDCASLQPTVCPFRYSFVAFNLAESVSLCISFWVTLLTWYSCITSYTRLIFQRSE